MEPFQSLGKYFCSSLLADRIDERCEVSYTCINKSNMSHWLLLGHRGINRDVAFYQSSVSTTDRAPVTAPPPKDPVYEALCRENQKVGPQEFSTDLASTHESRSLLIHIQSGATCTQHWTFRNKKTTCILSSNLYVWSNFDRHRKFNGFSDSSISIVIFSQFYQYSDYPQN